MRCGMMRSEEKMKIRLDWKTHTGQRWEASVDMVGNVETHLVFCVMRGDPDWFLVVSLYSSTGHNCLTLHDERVSDLFAGCRRADELAVQMFSREVESSYYPPSAGVRVPGFDEEETVAHVLRWPRLEPGTWEMAAAVAFVYDFKDELPERIGRFRRNKRISEPVYMSGNVLTPLADQAYVHIRRHEYRYVGTQIVGSVMEFAEAWNDSLAGQPVFTGEVHDA